MTLSAPEGTFTMSSEYIRDFPARMNHEQAVYVPRRLATDRLSCSFTRSVAPSQVYVQIFCRRFLDLGFLSRPGAQLCHPHQVLGKTLHMDLQLGSLAQG